MDLVQLCAWNAYTHAQTHTSTRTQKSYAEGSLHYVLLLIESRITFPGGLA